jgi:hypothetical protein
MNPLIPSFQKRVFSTSVARCKKTQISDPKGCDSEIQKLFHWIPAFAGMTASPFLGCLQNLSKNMQRQS